MNILAIDPGDTKTGFCLLDSDDNFLYYGKYKNEDLFLWIKNNVNNIDLVVMEMPVIFGSSLHIRNTILFTGQLIQFLRHLNIKYYTGLTRRSVSAMFLKKKDIQLDEELSGLKSNDVKIKVIMKRIFGADLPLKSNDEIQALAIYCCYNNKLKEGKIDDRFYTNFEFPIPPKKSRKTRKKS